MLTESQIKTIKRLRNRLYSWDEIAEKTGLSRTMCYYAVRKRKTKAALRREKRAIQRATEIRILRDKVRWLEQKLASRGMEVTA